MEKVADKNPADDWRHNLTRFTPLHKAFMNGHFSICELFIDNFDDISPRTILERTPQQLAKQFGHWQLFYYAIGKWQIQRYLEPFVCTYIFAILIFLNQIKHGSKVEIV